VCGEMTYGIIFLFGPFNDDLPFNVCILYNFHRKEKKTWFMAILIF